MPSYALIDSGTTTTRVRLWAHDGVRWTGTRAAGARDTAIDGDDSKIRSALRDLLGELSREAPGEVEAAICSGMITSNMGLVEVPHLAAPATRDDLARGMQRHDLPDVASLPFYFVPGVKSLPKALDVTTLAHADVLRGEEAECTGLRELLRLGGPAVFVHVGSHHKAIDADGAGTILASRTAITGELLAATMQHTILRNSVAPLDGLTPDARFWRAGVEAVREHGVGRALFLVRVGEQLWGRSKGDMSSFLLGALAALDLPLLDDTPADVPVVPYGTGHFPSILATILEEQGRTVVRVDPPLAQQASATGAVRLFERRRQLAGRK